MCLSHAYGTPPDQETAAAVLLKALDLGYTHIDSAALYGFGANETPHRQRAQQPQARVHPRHQGRHVPQRAGTA